MSGLRVCPFGRFDSEDCAPPSVEVTLENRFFRGHQGIFPDGFAALGFPSQFSPCLPDRGRFFFIMLHLANGEDLTRQSPLEIVPRDAFDVVRSEIFFVTEEKGGIRSAPPHTSPARHFAEPLHHFLESFSTRTGQTAETAQSLATAL